MKSIIFISGAKGGTGKTTLMINVAVMLAYMWRDAAVYPVALLDLTPGIGTAALILLGDHLSAWGRPSLSDYLAGKMADPLRAFYLRRWETEKGRFQIVFAYVTYEAPLAKRQLEVVINTIATRLKPKAVFIDAPPQTPSSPLVGLVDYIVPVVTPDISAIEAARSFLESTGVKKLKPVMNMYIPEYAVSAIHGVPWEIVVEKMLGDRPHVIPYDKALQAARQALEIESLKLRPYESPALKAIAEYAKYLASVIA